MKKVLFAAALALLLVAGIVYAAGPIVNTAHDLSSTGPWSGTFTSPTGQICIFCHTPHGAQTAGLSAPLWNHAYNATNTTYTPYNSPTFNGNPVSIGPVSRACLTCHDGTIAVDSFYGHGDPVSGHGYFYNELFGGVGPSDLISGNTFVQDISPYGDLGTDLSNDHPIGFNYVSDPDPGIQPPDAGNATISGYVDSTKKFPLYSNQMECATCHNVHSNGDGTPFLRDTLDKSQICEDCHINK
jgi:hypothetical protein